MSYVGLDIHNKHVAMCVLDENGKVFRPKHRHAIAVSTRFIGGMSTAGEWHIRGAVTQMASTPSRRNPPALQTFKPRRKDTPYQAPESKKAVSLLSLVAICFTKMIATGVCL